MRNASDSKGSCRRARVPSERDEGDCSRHRGGVDAPRGASMDAARGIILLKLVVLIAVAKLAGEIAERLRQPAVLGELLAGVLLGPSLFGLFDLSVDAADVHLVVFL